MVSFYIFSDGSCSVLCVMSLSTSKCTTKKQLKVHYGVPPDIQGHVTAKFNNVSWEQALKVILEMHDCIYIKEGSGLKVLIKLRMAKD